MIRKIAFISMFLCATITGISFAYGAISFSKIAYKEGEKYISKISIPSFLSRGEAVLQQGGPEIVESNLNEVVEEDIPNFVIKKNTRTPYVIGKSFLVADIKTGKVILSKNINEQLPIASVTKLMTAVIADEIVGLDTKTVIQSSAINTYGTQGELKKGESYSVHDLLYPLLLESSNDAAEAIAMSEDRNVFISEMNTKANALNLSNTIYEDASGLSENNKSTVTDLFRLTQYISKYRSYIFDITDQPKKQFGKKIWVSNSRFIQDKKYVGGKNGYTDEALKTQVALFEEDVNGEKRTFVYIVLRSTDIAKDIKNLRDYVRKNVSI